MSLYNGLGRGMSVFGGAEENLVDKYKMYKLSAEADAKRQMVKKLCEVFKGLKFDVPDFPTSDDPVELEQCADQLKEVVAKRLKRGLKEDEASREKVCRLLAREINNIFGGQLIDTSLGVESVCASVTEFCLSFARGLHLEYFTVQADVKKSITNCKLLLEVMDKLSKQVKTYIADAKDPELTAKYASLDRIYTRAAEELKKQVEILSNLMNIKTADDPLSLAFKERSDLRSIVESLGVRTDDFKTGKYADNIVQILLGLTTLAEAAARVHTALKQVGMTAEDYTKLSTMDDLKHKLKDLSLKRTDNFDLFSKAEEVLKKNFDPESEDWKSLKEKLGGAGVRLFDADEYDEQGRPNYDESGRKKTSMTKQLEKLSTERKALVKLFSKTIGEQYATLAKELKSIVSKLGKEIKINDQTNHIRNVLKYLVSNYSDDKRIELSLLGISNDVQTREIREQFISTLKQVISACSGVSHFDGLSKACDEMLKTIEHFYESSRSKFGGAEGGAGENYADELPKMARSGASLKKSINEFVYFYYLAKVKKNFEQTGNEIEEASAEYVKLLGAAVANRIAEAKKQFASYKKLVTLGNFSDQGNNTKFDDLYAASSEAPAQDHQYAVNADGAAQFAEYTKIYNRRVLVLENFYSALQAIDLYLKEFTVEMSRNPEKVLELKNMIDETEMINNWFNEQTGNSIVDFFTFPIVNLANVGANKFTKIDTDTHYYDTVKRQEANIDANLTNVVLDAANMPQDGYPALGDNMSKHVDKIFDNFSGLKNFISIFAKIGDLGNRKIFLSPAQIYKFITDFIKEAAVDYGKIHVGALHIFGAMPAQIGSDALANASVSVPLKYEREYLAKMLKAMSAKIFATIGLYNVYKTITPVTTINQTRVILGGADDVEPITEAAELYFRLPRLLEYYRNILQYTRSEAKDALVIKKISLIPEMSSLYGPLIKFIFKFDDSAYVYSDHELRTIIREVNTIHLKKNTDCDTIISEVVREINSRFGVVKSEDMKKYYAEIDEYKRSTNAADRSETDYELFANEDEKAYNKPPSSFYTTGDPTDRTLIDERKIESNYKFIDDFRDEIDKSFKDLKPESLELNYDLIIKETVAKMKLSQSADEKLRLAYSLIQNTLSTKISGIKVQLFQETVVIGLESLHNIKLIVDNFVHSVYRLEVVRRMQEEILRSAGADGVARLGADDFEVATNVQIMRNAGAVNLISRIPNEEHKNACNQTPKLEPKHLGDTDACNKLYTTHFYCGQGQPTRAADALIKIVAPATSIVTAGAALTIPAAGLNINDGPQNTIADIDQLNKILGEELFNATSDNTKYRALLALATDYDRAMRDLLETTFNFINSSSGLVTLAYNNDKSITFNYAKLRETINNISVSVKKYIEMFKPYIPSAIMKKYIDISEEYSLYHLEEKLIFNRFDNDHSDNMFHIDQAIKAYNKVLKWLIADKPDILTAMRSADPGTAYVACNADNMRKVPYSYCNVFSQIVYQFSGATVANRKAITESDIIQLIKSTKIDGTTVDAPLIVNSSIIKFNGSTSIFSRANYIDTNKMVENKSLVQMFNQLLERYITTCSELSPAIKTYANLISPICNGPLNKVITEPECALPDTYIRPDDVQGTTYRRAAGPNITATPGTVNYQLMAELLNTYNGPLTEENIVLYSIARVLQTLLKRVLRNTSIPMHLVTSLTDVSPHIKEQLRCNLPYFTKFADLLVAKCEFLVKFIEKISPNLINKQFCTVNTVNTTSIYSNITAPAAGAALIGANDANGGASNLLANGQDRAWFTTDITKAIRPFNLTRNGEALTVNAAGEEYNDNAYLLKLLRKLSEAAFTLSDSASNVLKELGDNAIYGQISENSIETYEKRYGKVPITPYSSVFSIINSDMQLFATSGNNKFKQNYAIRAILDNLTLQKLPYTEKQLAEYNELAKSDEKLSDYETFIKNVNMAINYYWEVRLKGKIVNTTIMVGNTIGTDSGVLMNNLAAAAFPQITSELTDHWRNKQEIDYARSLTFKVLPNRGDVITAAKGAENKPTGQRGYGTKNMLYYEDFVTTVVEQSDREEYEKTLMNFYVDVSSTTSRSAECVQNIIDMNIVPFNIHMLMRDVPLINVYNYDYSFGKFVDEFLQTRKYNELFDTMNTKQLFADLLKNPYLDITNPNKFHLMRGIFVGDDSLGMGRPKFLSDQLFNKCLLQNVYDERTTAELKAVNTYSVDPKTEGRKLLALVHRITNYFSISITSLPVIPIHNGPARPSNIGDFSATGQVFINSVNTFNDLTLVSGPDVRAMHSYVMADILADLHVVTGTNVNNALGTCDAIFQNLATELTIAKDIDDNNTGGAADQWGTDIQLNDATAEHNIIYNKIVAFAVNLATMTAVGALPNYAAFVAYVNSIPTDDQIQDMMNITRPGGLFENNQVLQNAIAVNQYNVGGGGTASQPNSDYNRLYNVAEINAIDVLNEQKAGLTVLAGIGAAGANNALLLQAFTNIIPCCVNAKIVKKYFDEVMAFGALNRINAPNPTNFESGFIFYCRNLSRFITNYFIKRGVAINGIVAAIAAANQGFMVRDVSTNTSKRDAYMQDRTQPGRLTYTNSDGLLVQHVFTAEQMAKFDDVYEYRFNSYLVRDLFFITNINRLLRQVFENELTGSREVVKHGYELANAGLTEYGQYPMKPNEISTSNQGNGLRRLVRDADSAEFYNSS
jgi:hypothetical protein